MCYFQYKLQNNINPCKLSEHTLVYYNQREELHSRSLGSGSTGFWATETLELVTLIIPKIKNA